MEGIGMEAWDKNQRLLSLYERLREGQVLYKAKEAQRFHVTQKSIQRDIEELRCFFADKHDGQDVQYDPCVHGYRLCRSEGRLDNCEILAVCKILLDSRSMIREEMLPLLNKLLDCCVPEQNRRKVGELIANEQFHYIEPHHGKRFLSTLWEIADAVSQHRVMEMEYEKLKNHETVHRVIEPVGIMFSEYYFYLTAFIRDIDKDSAFENPDDLYPTIYRIDRIQSYQVTDEHFAVRYADRFEEGEFRKRVQFMFGGRLQTIKFRYTGPSIEAVLDRLPTAKATENPAGGWDVIAEVFGKGIEIWLNGLNGINGGKTDG